MACSAFNSYLSNCSNIVIDFVQNGENDYFVKYSPFQIFNSML